MNLIDVPLSAAILMVPSTLDTRQVISTAEHVILRHLVATLVIFESKSSVKGLLAKSWKISDDFKEYSFYLSDHFFSNGTPILPKDVINSIRLQVEFGETIHYDFRRILKIEEVPETGVKFTLKQPDKHFLYQLMQSEFGVLHHTDVSCKLGDRTFSVTSGPFRIKSRTNLNISLTRNHFFVDWLKDSPEDFNFISVYDPSINELIKSNKLLTLAVFPRTIEILRKAQDESYKLYQPRSTQTGFVALNGKSKACAETDVRRYVQKILRKIDFKLEEQAPMSSRANQLFFPGGPSQLNSDEEAALWEEIESSTKPKYIPNSLKFVAAKGNPNVAAINSALKNAGFDVDLQELDLKHFFAKVLVDDFDLLLISSDFASAEVLDNIVVSAGDGKSIVFNSGSKIPQLIIAAHEESDATKRAKIVKDIGYRFINEGYVFPFVYSIRTIVVHPGFDFSNWSQFYPDVSIWRMPKLKNNRTH